MQKIKTLAEWVSRLTSADISEEYSEERPYMAFAGGWDGLRLSVPSDGGGVLCQSMFARLARVPRHPTYLSERAKHEIAANAPWADVRYMR